MAKQGLLGHVRLNVNFGKTDVVALDMLYFPLPPSG